MQQWIVTVTLAAQADLAQFHVDHLLDGVISTVRYDAGTGYLTAIVTVDAESAYEAEREVVGHLTEAARSAEIDGPVIGSRTRPAAGLVARLRSRPPTEDHRPAIRTGFERRLHRPEVGLDTDDVGDAEHDGIAQKHVSAAIDHLHGAIRPGRADRP